MTRHAVSGAGVRPERLKKRADFVRAAGGRKSHGSLVTLQAFERPAGEPEAARIGFTVTKKVGNAVERNRIRRRLREAVRISDGLGIKPSHDYVILARRTVLDERFGNVVEGLRAAFLKIDRLSGGGRVTARGRRPAPHRRDERS